MTRRAGPRTFRPAGSDDLGLRRALSDRLLPLLVGAMAFLAALALAGAFGASALARRWQGGAASLLLVQVPHLGSPAPDGRAARLARVLALLQAAEGVASARVMPAEEVAGLLRPWLGSGPSLPALPLPAVVEVRLSGPEPPGLAARLEAEAPGVLVEAQEAWVSRLAALAQAVRACAGAAVGLVGAVSAAVVAVATRAGLAARRDAIEIVHGLGATRGYIAGRFAGRVTLLAALGGLLGTAIALPVLAGLANLLQPFRGGDAPVGLAGAVPPELWLSLLALPLAAACIGWLTAQGTVRRWLRRLP